MRETRLYLLQLARRQVLLASRGSTDDVCDVELRRDSEWGATGRRGRHRSAGEEEGQAEG